MPRACLLTLIGPTAIGAFNGGNVIESMVLPAYHRRGCVALQPGLWHKIGSNGGLAIDLALLSPEATLAMECRTQWSLHKPFLVSADSAGPSDQHHRIDRDPTERRALHQRLRKPPLRRCGSPARHGSTHGDGQWQSRVEFLGTLAKLQSGVHHGDGKRQQRRRIRYVGDQQLQETVSVRRHFQRWFQLLLIDGVGELLP